MESKFLDKPVVHIALVAIMGLLAYSNTFTVPFTFDDVLIISRNPDIRDISNIPAMFLGKAGPFASRPLLHATAAINYHFGGVDVRGYHALNLALHLLNGALLYLLIAATGRHMRYPERETSLAALFSAALFVLHPVQTEAVTYVVSRSMLFATAFYLLGMLLFLKAATSEARRPLYIAALAVVSLLGMGSREDFATFPLMLLLYDLFFISEFRFKAALRHWKAYLPVLMSLGYLAHLVANNTYGKGDLPGGIPPVEYAMTQFKVHWTYIRLLLLPINQNLDYDYPVANTLLELPTVLPLVGYAGLWAGAAVMARRKPLASFLALWFLVILLPVSFGVTFLDLRLDYVIFEHRLYLPGVGILIALAAGAVRLARFLKGRSRTAAVAMLGFAFLAMASGSYARNGAWRDEIALWEDAVRKAPGKAKAHNNLGVAYKDMGRIEAAIKEFEVAIRQDPSYSLPHSSLGFIYESSGMVDKAIEHYEAAVRLDPSRFKTHTNLGFLYFYNKGMADKAIEHFEAALAYAPDEPQIHLNLAIAYKSKGLSGKADEHLAAARRLNPAFFQPKK